MPYPIRNDACIPGVTAPVCQIPLPVCTPPQRLVCLPIIGSNPPALDCQCAETGGPPSHPISCTLSIVHDVDAPLGARLDGVEASCSYEASVLAISVVLTRLLALGRF